MATYYVRKSGSDSNDGSTGTPWLTVHKALTTCAAGDTINVGNGVYQENSAAAGYLNVTVAFATVVVIQAEDGDAGIVCIQGTSGNYNVRETIGTKLHWKYIEFVARAGSLYNYEFSRLASDITFTDCYFECANANATYGLVAFTGSGSSITNALTLTRCTFYHPYAGSGYCAEINPAAAVATVTMTNCRMYSNSGGIRFLSTNNNARLIVTGGRYESTRAGTQAFLCGTDGSVGSNAPVAGTMTGVSIKGVGHALEIGGANATTGVTVTKSYIEGTGDFALVLKDCDNAVITDNVIRLYGVISTGTPSAIFSKGSRHSRITANTVIADSGHAIANWNDVTGYNTVDLQATGNNFILKGASNFINWNSARDGGQNYFDSNILLLRGSGNIGTIFAVTGIASLLDLQTAWTTAGYPLNSALDVLLTAANDTTPTQLNSIFSSLTNIQSRLPAALTTNGNMKSSLLEIISTALTEGATGRLAAAWQAAWNVAASVWTSASVNQTGDSYVLTGSAAVATLAAISAEAVKTADIQSRLPAALSGGRMPAELDSATQAQLDAIETAIEEIQTSFTEATVTVTGYASIDTDGVLQLKRAETATLTFTSDSANLVPDLSAGTTKIVMGIKDTAGRVWLSLTGTVLVATGLQSVRFVLTPTLSLALIKGHHNFDVLAIYGYDAGSTPPYASLKTFTSGRVTVTDVYLDPLGL